MKVSIISAKNNYVLHSMFISLLILMICKSNVVFADALTYSPDQWPRHWNVLINQSQTQDVRRGGNGYARKKPLRSPRWGVIPRAKQISRRTLRPEYNTNTSLGNYVGENIYNQNYYSGFSGYGLANPYASPLLVPGLMPGLTAPGLPFISNPYGGNPYRGNPYRGGLYSPGYRW